MSSRSTPEPIVKYLHDVFKYAYDSDYYQRYQEFSLLHLRPGYLNSDDADAFVKDQYEMMYCEYKKRGFLNGKETALTSLVNKKAKQCIDSSETNHFQKVTAYVCLAHMIIRTQKKISVQSQCLFSKYENVEKWWQFLILEEDYPSQPWCKTNNLLLETVVATLDTLFDKSAALPSDYGEDAWAEYADVNLDDSENSGPKKWVRVPNSPMPPFMDTMCKMACKVDSGVFLPMHIKIFQWLCFLCSSNVSPTEKCFKIKTTFSLKR